MTQQVWQRPRSGRQWRVTRISFVVVLVALTVADVLVSDPTRASLSAVVEALGAGALVLGVWIHRPVPRVAWWLVSAAFALLAVATLSAEIAARVGSGGYDVPDPTRPVGSGAYYVPVVLGAVAMLCLASGLIDFSRRLARGGPTDALDAAMMALACYLLLWVLLIEPTIRGRPVSVTAAVLVPMGTLLILTSAGRLALAGGWRIPALLVILVVSVGLIVEFAAVFAVIVTGLAAGGSEGMLRVSDATYVLIDAYFIALGWLGLHPSLLRGIVPLSAGPEAPSRQRIALFAVLAVIPPLVWLLEIGRSDRGDRSMASQIVPPLLSALFLLLLVVRLGLVTRLAQRRANALAESVEEQAKLQDELRYQAQHDPLTGLPNRAVLGEAVQAALRPPYALPVALLLLDLDQFKDVNDTLGHPVGDDLLVEVADRLRSVMPATGTLARLGGDEFAVLLCGSDAANAVQISERLVRELRRPYQVRGHELQITTSVGLLVTNPKEHSVAPPDLLRDADQALYAAKAAGKNRVHVFATLNGPPRPTDSPSC